jgi:hypothetical protein
MVNQDKINLSIIIIVGILASIFLSTPPDDDAFITFRYAENILEGKGFTYNIGEQILGTTTPLFTILLAIFGLTGIDIPKLSMVLCTIFLLLSGVTLYHSFQENGERKVGFAAALLIFLNPWILQSFGNEMTLHLFLHFGIIYFFVKKKFSISWIYAGLALLNRGDGIIISGILFIFCYITAKKIPWRGIFIHLSTITPWFIFSSIYFGSFFPSTLKAKVAQGNSGLFGDFVTYTKNYIFVPINDYPVLYIFYFFAILGLISLLKGNAAWKMLFIWVFTYFMGYQLLGVSFALRYFIPLTAAIFIFAAKGIDYGSAFIANRTKILLSEPIEAVTKIHFIVIILTMVISATYIAYRSNRCQDFTSRGVIYKSTGKWLEKNTKKDSTIGLIEIGFIGYYSKRKIIDFCGLVTPVLIRNIQTRDFSFGFIEKKPDYFVYNTEFEFWLKDIVNTDWFKSSYEPIASIKNDLFQWSPIYIYKKKQNSKFDLFRMVDQKQDKVDSICGRIYGTNTVGQSFICNENNLCGVEVFLATYKKAINCKFEFYLFEQNNNWKLIRKVIFENLVLDDNSWHSFVFDPIFDSKHKKYCFILKAPELSEQDAFTVWLSTEDSNYKFGSFIINGINKEGDLCFRTFYK